MSRQAARNDEQRVDSDVISRTHLARRSAATTTRRSRQSSSEKAAAPFCRAGLHLDDGERSSSPRDDIDLAAGDTRSTR
jgi:hypothetical protein